MGSNIKAKSGINLMENSLATLLRPVIQLPPTLHLLS